MQIYTFLFYLDFSLRSIEFLIFPKKFTFFPYISFIGHNVSLVSAVKGQVNGACYVGFLLRDHDLQKLQLIVQLVRGAEFDIETVAVPQGNIVG